MKYVKLILIIAVVAGLIYGAFSIVGPNSSTTNINPESPTLLNDLTRKVDNDWENATEWNKDVYDKNISDAQVYHKDLDMASAGNYTTLINYTNEKVCNKLIEFINAEFAKSNCSPSAISQMKKDIDYFVQKNGTIDASDSRIATACKKISLYQNILAFGKKTFLLSPSFNFSSGNWADFDRYRAEQLRKRDSFKNAGNYSSLSHISDIKTSLSSVENKLSDAKNRFEHKLSDEIIYAYSSVPRTQANMMQFQRVYNRYYDNHYRDGDKLSQFRKRFKKEVEEESFRGKPRTKENVPDNRW